VVDFIHSSSTTTWWDRRMLGLQWQFGLLVLAPTPTPLPACTITHPSIFIWLSLAIFPSFDTPHPLVLERRNSHNTHTQIITNTFRQRRFVSVAGDCQQNNHEKLWLQFCVSFLMGACLCVRACVHVCVCEFLCARVSAFKFSQVGAYAFEL